MFDVPIFLMRWLFVSNLVRDVAEIQTLPVQPYHAPPHFATPHHHQQHPFAMTEQQREDWWRDHCVRGVLSYPPGHQRLLVLDALRCELVQQLKHCLSQSDDILMQHTKQQSSISKNQARKNGEYDDGMNHENNEDDPYLDADTEIIRSFDKLQQQDDIENINDKNSNEKHDERQAALVISDDGTKILESLDDDKANISTRHLNDTGSDNMQPVPQQHHHPQNQQKPHESEIPNMQSSENSDHDDTLNSSDNCNMIPTEAIHRAIRTREQVRSYLPQLVSSVLKSPPPFDPHLAHPIQKLRELLLTRCLQDPSWGIEMCWLLEAEVGRAWKTLFEHRQQTGRRLIVVLPAEKAAVLAKIGTEKREAFDLLQDAEQATAYGYTTTTTTAASARSTTTEQQQHFIGSYQQQQHDHLNVGDHDVKRNTRLPSSLSLRRCSHFGDTMHFVDRLTRVSMDLRMIPTTQRETFLKEHLNEMNRRIRRRMVTRGDVSLDVEDSRSPYDWPHLDDLTTDMIKYSVHFPLISQSGTWPNGESAAQDAKQSLPSEVFRVLNIVVAETRILASRERCPFLVHLEVLDSGLEGNDARLYASGAPGLGATMEEALGMSAVAAAASASHRRTPLDRRDVAYGIPVELLHPAVDNNGREAAVPRGGSQADGYFMDHQEHEFMYHSDPYQSFRQHEFEQLHQQLSTQPLHHPQTHLVPHPHVSTSKFGVDLLDSVYGSPWQEKCREIRAASPFGHLAGWRLASFIMKAGEDIRREALVMQIISKLRTWFEEEIPENQRPYLRPYTIMCVGGDAGLLECLTDAKSVDEVKKRVENFVSLRDYFERAYGPPSRQAPLHRPRPFDELITFDEAQENFLRSLVGYSLVCYVLQIKDRHNANILLDREGHIMHIDFGFVLGDTPKMGKVPLFSERAPFKLSGEFWEVLGGWNVQEGGLGVRFCKMFELAFACASSHVDEIASLVEATALTLNANPRQARAIANGVRSRLRMRGPPGSTQQKMFIMDLVNAALTSWGTSTYDWLQRSMNGYQ